MTDHRGHDYAPTPLHDIDHRRAVELAAMMDARPSDAAALERMVYGPQPLTDGSRSIIAEWCE